MRTQLHPGKFLHFFLIIMVAWSCASKAQLSGDEKETKEVKESTIVFMGNSITEHWPNYRPEFFAGRPFINRGISGQTTTQMLARFSHDVIDVNPAVVIILAGTNDLAGNGGPIGIDAIAENIFTMAEQAISNDIQVLLASVLPATDYPWSAGKNPKIKIPQLNTLIKDYAKENGIIYVDYFNTMANEKNGIIESLAYDGIHPNKEGYMVMEPLTIHAIEKVLKNKR